jgi:hypothetical protein
MLDERARALLNYTRKTTSSSSRRRDRGVLTVASEPLSG